jgi:hypothetical protein
MRVQAQAMRVHAKNVNAVSLTGMSLTVIDNLPAIQKQSLIKRKGGQSK